MSTERMAILGAGHAGLSIAETLRRKGHQGPVMLIGAEPGLPYQRPPLSKQYLKGEWDESRLEQRNAAFYTRQRIELKNAAPVVRIDRQKRQLEFADGEHLDWDRLAIATGARVRRLDIPGSDLAGIHYLQTLDQARTLRAELTRASSVVVIGGGYIGLEGAAAFALAGKKVTLLNRSATLLSHSVGATLAEHLVRLHQQRGVQIENSVEVTAFTGRQGRMERLMLSDGRQLEADLVLVGIGVEPQTALAEAAGIRCRDGILVDACCRTSDPRVVAAGDCTRFDHPLLQNRSVRLESIQNAVEQGRHAAATLLGEVHPYAAVPWFWSDQYEAKIQIAGVGTGHNIEVVRGNPDEGRFSVFCYAHKRLVAVESVNAPAEHMLARKLLQAGISLSPDEAADPDFPLRQLLP